MKIGIVGLGSFGQLAARTFAADSGPSVVAYDPRDVEVPSGVLKVGFEEVTGADAIILCVPLMAYQDVLERLKPLLQENTLIVDICSVKVLPERLLRKHLPNHRNLLITHPMFGPQTAKDGFAGLPLVVCAAEGELAEKAVKYCENKLQLKIVRMTSDEHDREMADVHALTFFVGRGLTDFGVKPRTFAAPSYKWLLDLSALDKIHTEELFRTMVVGNPYAKSAREKFVKTLQGINDQLDGDK